MNSFYYLKEAEISIQAAKKAHEDGNEELKLTYVVQAQTLIHNTLIKTMSEMNKDMELDELIIK